MGTILLMFISCCAVSTGQYNDRDRTILRAGQNGRPQNNGNGYYADDDIRPPPPQYRPNPRYNNYDNRQRYNNYPVRQNGPSFNNFNAPGAAANNRYGVTPVSPPKFEITPFSGGAADTFQANPTQTSTTSTTTTTTTTTPLPPPTPNKEHNDNHSHKHGDDEIVKENAINEEAMELTDAGNDTDDSVEIHPSSHAQTDEQGHYGAFHISTFTTILFTYWTTDNAEELFFSCLGIAALAVFSEGMSALKEWLVVRFTNNYQSKASCRKTLHYCGLHIAKSIVYMIQLTSAYLLMLIAMTYNIYLFIAVILGSGIGHVMFSVISYRSQAGANI